MAQQKLSNGTLVVQVMYADLPPVMDPRDERARAVAETAARLVLVAMATFTNPTRDQRHGPARMWQCWATEQTIAERAGVSDRQVQRVIRAYVRLGWIDELRVGRPAGRPRQGQEARPATPSLWALRPDRWALRGSKEIATNSSPFRAIGSSDGISPVPAEIVPVPGLNRDESGAAEMGELTGARYPELKSTGNLKENLESEPARAARDIQATLPGVAAVLVDDEGARRRCPDCGQTIDDEGRGHRGGVNACRAVGRLAEITRCDGCGEWVDRTRRFHLTRCPTLRESETIAI